jgi:hypothetical protein
MKLLKRQYRYSNVKLSVFHYVSCHEDTWQHKVLVSRQSHARPIYPMERSRPIPINRNLTVPRRRFGHCESKKILYPWASSMYYNFI